MTRSRMLCTWLTMSTILIVSFPVQAHEGHKHDDAPPAVVGDALPRFALESDDFELVGELDGARLRLWLDRRADNAPVPNARIELEVAGTRVVATPDADAYLVTLAAPLPAGRHAVSATLQAGAEADLLAGEVTIVAPATVTAESRAADWTRLLPAGVALLGAGAALGALLARRRPQPVLPRHEQGSHS